MRFFIFILLSCSADPVARTVTDNSQIPVDTLFTKDDCTVYRFADGGYHYFVKCKGVASASTMTTESCGENCTREVAVPTLPVE